MGDLLLLAFFFFAGAFLGSVLTNRFRDEKESYFLDELETTIGFNKELMEDNLELMKGGGLVPERVEHRVIYLN